MKETIRDFHGNIIATIEDASNGDLIARDFIGNIIGRYDKHCNVTREFSGRIIGPGNQLGVIIGMNKK